MKVDNLLVALDSPYFNDIDKDLAKEGKRLMKRKLKLIRDIEIFLIKMRNESLK